MPPVRRGPARLGPGSFAIVFAVLGLLPIGVATLGTPALGWPTVSATATDCHAVAVRSSGRRHSQHEVTRCLMRWTGEDGPRAARVGYPLGDVFDGTVKPLRVNGSRAADPGAVYGSLRLSVVLGGALLLLAGFLGYRWWVRRRRTVRR